MGGWALGLDVDADFPIAGIPSGDVPPGAAKVRIEPVTPALIEERWRVIEEHQRPVVNQIGPRPGVTLGHSEDDWWKLEVEGFGPYLFEPGGRRVLCAVPAEVESWRFHRFLTGEVLPLVALLCGHEVLHASAVCTEAGVLAVSGRSGAGKSSIALHLARRGRPFFSDDVLVIAAGGILCHAGPAAVHVRDPELREAAVAGEPPFRQVLAEDGSRLRVLVDAERRSRPLRVLYLLEHKQQGESVRFECEYDPRRVMAASFNLFVRTPSRLAAQLDMASMVLSNALVVRVLVPTGLGASATADAIEAHAQDLA